MAPRPHDADDPGLPGPDDAGPHEDAQGPGPGRDPSDDDLDARWAEIVTELSGGDPRSWTPEHDEDDDHFVPPDPGPVLGGDPLLAMAWAAVVGVPMLLVVAVVVWRDMPVVLLQAAGVGFAAGLALLVWRMPRDRDHDGGPGAVV